MEEGEGQAAKGVGALQTRSFTLHVPEWVSQLLKIFQIQRAVKTLFPKDLLYTLYLSCFLAGYNDVQCINLCGVPIKAWSASLR